MKRLYKFRRWLFAPLVYLAAICLLFEECLWDAGARLMRRLAQFPPLRALEARIARLPPYWALAVFALPAVLLFPVKVLALLAIAHGHAFSGVGVIVLAKVGGAAAVARLYALTRPALLSLPWFARWHGKFIAVKDRWIARLRATRAWRRVDGMAAQLAAARRRYWAAWRARPPSNARPARLLRRFAAFWRARRRRSRQ
ncbi:hypothetical protein [Janthinobacterium fluminis]|uniref:Transmembrane protein n=1 Tax=Janthinobacterium fluminis TaxID=2987524 RepID=A0ABT5K3G5_9BURK|nr:hypothetical protein [Janthinobacterium fluminis]MDC8759291.1 hypothetical protein [Janthinobacterium fluminis]